MLALYIILGVIGGLVLLSFIASLIVHYVIFGKRFMPDPLVETYTTEEFNILREPLEVPCGKDTLRGFVYNKDGAIKDKLIVFNHGMSSTVDSYNQDICYFAAQGYTVIALNHVGVGTSTGKSIKGFSNSLRSLDHVLNWVNTSEYSNRDIYVMGHSWGGFATANICKYHPEVKKLVAISPFSSISRMVRCKISPALYFLVPFVYLVEYMRCGKYAFANARKSLNKFNGKALIVASRNDFIIDYQMNTGHLHHSVYGARYLINEDRYHNPNYTKDAVNYMVDYYNKVNACKGNEEALRELKKKTDFRRMGALDFEVMAKILKFIEE